MIVDEDLERELRVMLQRRSADIPEEGAAWLQAIAGSRPGRRRTLLVAAAGVVVVAGIGVVALRSGDDGGATLRTDTTAGPSPTGDTATTIVVDPSSVFSDGSLFTSEGDALAVAAAYFADRLPDVSVEVELAMSSDDAASFAWRWSEGNGDSGAVTGTMELVLVDGSWSVVQVDTDGVQLLDLVNTGTSVSGRVDLTRRGGVAVDILTLDGEPVPGSPQPDGVPGAAYRYGTAGWSDGPLAFDVPVEHEPVLVRAWTVGGTLLGVSELRLDPPSDGGTGTGVYTASGTAERVASSYLRARLGAIDDIEIGTTTVQGMTATVDWSRTIADGQVIAGSMGVTREGNRWSVLASEVDGVGIDLSGSSRETLRVSVTADLDADVLVELLDQQGTRLGRAVWPREIRPAGAGLISEFPWQGATEGVVRVTLTGEDDAPLAVAEQRVSVS